MAKQTEKAEGIVKSLRKDGKGLQFETGEWFSNKFFKGTLECEKGDKVEVEFSINGEYTNLEACKVIQKAAKKEIQKEIREDVNASQITSYAKDIVVAVIEKMGTEELARIKITAPEMMEIAAKAVAKAYKTIKMELMPSEKQQQGMQPLKKEEDPQEEYY